MRIRRLFIRAALALPVGLRWFAAEAADDHAREEPFTKLATPQPVDAQGKIEVIEFFWYECPHCRQVETGLEAWAKTLPSDVVLRREHIVWDGRAATAGQARLFATLRSMGIVERNQRAAFDAIQGSRTNLNDEKTLFAWVEQRGIDRARFEATYKSFGVNSQVARGRRLTSSYRIEGVPTFIVNGKFATSPHRAGDERKMFSLIDQLIANERTGKP